MTVALPSSLLGIFAAFVLLAAAPWAFAPHAPVKSALVLLSGGLAWVFLLLNWRSFAIIRRHPLPWIAAAFFCLTALSATFSVDAHRWMESSPLLPQHPLILAACLGIFLLAAAASRDDSSRRMWTEWLVRLSFPLCLVGLYQHLRVLDPLLSGVAFGSLAGNPLYLAGALLFLLPLTAWKWWEAWQAAGWNWNRPSVLLGLLLLLQCMTFLLTQKRGPLVALVVSVCGVLLLLGLLAGRRNLLRWALRVGVASALILTVLAAAHKFGLPVREWPLVGRMAMIVPLGEKTGDHFRSSLWRSAATFLSEPRPLLRPFGSEDPHARLRAWIGHGPDTVEAVLPSRWVHFGAWPQPYLEVSCHSSFWDLFLTLGVAGVLLHALFFATLLGVALTSLELLPLATGAASARWRFAVWSLLGAGAGGAAASLLLHPGFLGLGAQCGLLAGSSIFLLRENRTTSRTAKDHRFTPKSGFLLALLAGLIAHWVDMSFLFPTPGTAFLFWLAAGGILGASLPGESSPEKTDLTLSPRIHGVFNATVILLILQAVLWPYPGESFFHRASPSMWVALTFILLLPVAWGNALSLATGHLLRETIRPTLLFFLSGLLLLLLPLVFWSWGAGTWWWLTAAALVMPGLLMAAVVVLFFRPPATHPLRCLGITILLTGWGVVFWPSALSWLRSEVAHGATLRISENDAHRELLAQSLLDRPTNFRARLSLAGLADPAGNDLASAPILEEGMQISSFNPLSFHAADVYFLAALVCEEGEKRADLARRAQGHFLAAARYVPRWESAWIAAALLDELILENPAQAARFRVVAAGTTLQRGYPEQGVNTLGWAQYYLDRSNRFAGTPAEVPLARHALYYFQRAEQELLAGLLRRPPSPREEELLAPQWFWIYVGQGLMHRRLGKEIPARHAFAAAATVDWEKRPFDPGAFLGQE